MDDEDFPLARELALLAQKNFDRSNGKLLATRARARQREINDIIAEFEPAKRARDTLATKPDDAGANQQVGMFLAYCKGEWEEALPYFLRAKDVNLRQLADKELRNPTKPELVQLADTWWQVADGQKLEVARAEIRQHVKKLYTDALDGMPSGAARSRIETRLREIERQYFPKDDPPPDRTNPNSPTVGKPTPQNPGAKPPTQPEKPDNRLVLPNGKLPNGVYIKQDLEKLGLGGNKGPTFSNGKGKPGGKKK